VHQQCEGNTGAENKWKRAHLFLEIAQKAATLVGFDCFPFLAM
jgi:hypothetical protein